MKVIKWIDKNLEEFLMVFFLIAMTLVMGVQVFSRYILNYSLSWSEELTRYFFVWSAFISISYCTKKCLNIKIDQLLNVLPERISRYFYLLSHLVELIFFVYLIPFAIAYIESSIESGQLSPALGIPMYYVQVAPLCAFVLVSIRILQRLYSDIGAIRKG